MGILHHRRIVAGLAIAMALLPAAGIAAAEDRYPSRPLEFVVPWGPGGGADQLARKLASLMEPMLGVTMPVLNAPGATGQSGLMKMLTQEADGYEIEVMTADTFALFGSSSKIDPKQFVAVAIMIQQPSGLFVRQDAPWKTWADLEKTLRSKTLKVAITGFDSPDDISVNYLAAKGLKLSSVPYAKPGERYTSILGGHADILYEQAGDIRNFVDTKQMRPILFFADKRFAAFPDIPVSKELGYDVTLPQFRAVIIKAGTDPRRVQVISDALAKAAALPAYKTYLKDQYAEENSFVPQREAQRYMQDWLVEAKRTISAADGHK